MINKAPISVYTYCIEDPSKIENYESAKADNFKGWVCHHKLETKCPAYRPSRNDLIEWNLYFHRPAEELIFMKKDEHATLHYKGVSKRNKSNYKGFNGKHTEESKKRISEARIGKRMSKEFRKKISLRNIGNTYTKGKKWFNDGIISTMAFECPEGFVEGRIYRRGK